MWPRTTDGLRSPRPSRPQGGVGVGAERMDPAGAVHAGQRDRGQGAGDSPMVTVRPPLASLLRWQPRFVPTVSRMTSYAAGAGRSTSLSARMSGSPNFMICAAFMSSFLSGGVDPILGRGCRITVVRSFLVHQTHPHRPRRRHIDAVAEAPRRELAEFLRARRTRVRPEDVGLEPGPRRLGGRATTRGTRPAGRVSTDYYQRMEQRRDVRPSEQVLDALARALEFSPEESRHLHSLAATTRRRSCRPPHSACCVRCPRLLDAPGPASGIGPATVQRSMSRCR